MRVGRDDIEIMRGKDGLAAWNRSKVALRLGREHEGKACPSCLTTKSGMVVEGDPVDAEDLHENEVAVPARCLVCGSAWYGIYEAYDDEHRVWVKYCMLRKGDGMAEGAGE